MSLAFPAAAAGVAAPPIAAAILFVAPGVPEEQILPARFGEPVEVVRLRGGEDGVAQISRALLPRRGLSALYILGGGAAALDPAGVEAAAGQIAGWRAALRRGGAIRLHGCGLGASAEGWRVLGRLSALTGADVASCDEVTGATLLGG